MEFKEKAMYHAEKVVTQVFEYSQSNTTNFLIIVALVILVPLWFKIVFMSWRISSI